MCFIGFLIPFMVLMYPNYSVNLKGYFGYFVINNDWGSHFRLYKDYFFKKYAKEYNLRSSGIFWYFKFYFRMIPFHFIIYFLILIYFLIKGLFFHNNSYLFLIYYLVSILPIIWSHFTDGPKASLPFYTTFISIFIPIGFFYLDHNNLKTLYNFHYFIEISVYILLILSILYNIIVYINDIHPSRLTIKYVLKFLKKQNARKIYTIRSEFSEPFTDIIEKYYSDKVEIVYIGSFNEINSGFLFVPCLNSKASYYQSSRVGYDINLNKNNDVINLIRNNQNKNIIIYKFKSLGSSKFWQHLGDVVSFRDLILKEVSEEDRYIGHAWILKFN
jgi:hypothetical protein